MLWCSLHFVPLRWPQDSASRQTDQQFTFWATHHSCVPEHHERHGNTVGDRRYWSSGGKRRAERSRNSGRSRITGPHRLQCSRDESRRGKPRREPEWGSQTGVNKERWWKLQIPPPKHSAKSYANFQPGWGSRETECRQTKKDGGESHGQQKQRVAENEAKRSKGKSQTDGKGPSNSRRKAFITLSYIVLAYVLCWSPFHFVFDVSLASPESVSADLYTAAFWLACINSGLNPFMYAFSSADFRTAVVHIMKCRFCKP